MSLSNKTINHHEKAIWLHPLRPFNDVSVCADPQEIISRMETEMNNYEKSGVAMTVDVKIPILGKMSTRTYTLGDKMRLEAAMMGVKLITWSDGVTEWTYNEKENEIEIQKAKENSESREEGDIGMFAGITDGYDVSIDKETSTEWHIRCKKSKNNPDKDAPKKMNLVISKGTYWPVSLSASMSGVDMTMREISFGVTEQQVTFDPKAFPNAKIVDKR